MMESMQEDVAAISKAKIFYNLSLFSRILITMNFKKESFKIGDMPIRQGELKEEIILVQYGCCDLIHEKIEIPD
jgi:hypothetical protein